MITQEDIAKIVGVSKSTVSKALRGSSDINAGTARMIVEVAVKNGYQIKSKPDGKGGAAKVVGVLCPEARSDYYSQITDKLSQKLQEEGYHTIFSYSDFDYTQEVRIINMLLEQNVAGIICITEFTQISKYIKAMTTKHKIPVLHIGINVQDTELDSICVNEERSLLLAVSHLLEQGHKSLAFIGDRFSNVRQEYFLDALKKSPEGVIEHVCLIDSELRHAECGYKLMGELLKRGKLPTAIVAAYDNIALGAIRRISDEGMRIPGNFSIIGCDNSFYTPYLPVALTTIDGHIKEMCDIAVSILRKKIFDSGYKAFQSVQIIPELVIRESTGRPG